MSTISLNRIANAGILISLVFAACSFNNTCLKAPLGTIDNATEQRIPGDEVVDRSKQTILENFDVEGQRGLFLEIIVERYGMVHPQG